MKTKNYITILLITLALIAAAIFKIQTKTASCLPANSIWIEPFTLSFNTATTPVGFRFNVTIYTNLSVSTYAWQIYLTYNKNHLAATGCWYSLGAKSQWAGTNPTQPVTPSYGSHNATHNYVLFGESLQGQVSTPPGVYTLAIIQFEITSTPPPGQTYQSELRLDIASETSPALRTKILDSARKTITLNYGGTTYTYTSPPAPPEIATIYVDPEEIIDPTLLPPAVFHVNITINNVQNLYEYEFNMSFNNQVLTCLYIIIHDVQGETNYMPEMQINNPKGFIWIRVTYYPPANPITTTTPLALATIQFRVKSVGASVLDLHDTQLINNQGNPITHEAKDGYVMTLIRDIAITSVVPSRNWAYAEWPVNISVTVKNLGYITENFTVSAYYDTNLIGTLEILNLSPSEERTVTLLWNTTGLSQGNYTLSARAPALQFETNIANNVYVDGQITILTAIRDIAITNVSTPSWTYQGWIVDITVTVKNLGTSVESFNVTIYLDETAINTTKIVNLPPSSEVNLTFKWNTSEATPCNTYIVWAEATLTPYEYNTTNNLYVDGTIKVRIMGDINGDGLVDITDIAAVSDAYGSAPGAPNWNPAADVNQDELIDVEDVALVSSKFGSIC